MKNTIKKNKRSLKFHMLLLSTCLGIGVFTKPNSIIYAANAHDSDHEPAYGQICNTHTPKQISAYDPGNDPSQYLEQDMPNDQTDVLDDILIQNSNGDSNSPTQNSANASDINPTQSSDGTSDNTPTQNLVCASGNEPTQSLVCASGNEPTQSPVYASGNEPAQNPVSASGNNPAQNPVSASGNNPVQSPVYASGNNPTQNPISASGNEPTQNPVSASGNNPTQNPVSASDNNTTQDPDNASDNTPTQGSDDDPGNDPSQNPADDATQPPKEEWNHTDQQGVIYDLNPSNNTCSVSSFTKDIKKTISIPTEIIQDDITYKVRSIRASAFKNCRSLHKIEIPNSITNIAGNLFSGCTNLSNITIIPVKFTTSTSDKTSVVKLYIDNAFLSTSAKVKLEIDKNVITKATANKKTDKLTLKILIAKNASYTTTVAMPDHIILQPQAANEIVLHGKSFLAIIKDAAGNSYRTTVSASELEKTNYPLNLTLVKMSINSTSGSSKTDLKKAFKKNGLKENETDIYHVANNNNMQISLKLTVTVNADDEAYIYRYNKSKRTFVSLSYHPFAVSKNKTVKFTASKGGFYVIAPQKFSYMYSMPRNQFLVESGSTYYVDQHGELLYGWNKIGNGYYYFDRENGKMASGTTVDGIAVTRSGTAENRSSYINKIQVMMKARTIVQQITNSTDSNNEKIRKCFLWIFQFPYKQYRTLKPLYTQEGWEITFANDIFDRHQGCCVSEASALAFLFHECGYPTVYICHDTGHAWVELNGRVYDPLFAEARGIDNYYNVSYPQYRLYPVGKRLI